jgi:hypothetical protein
MVSNRYYGMNYRTYFSDCNRLAFVSECEPPELWVVGEALYADR